MTSSIHLGSFFCGLYFCRSKSVRKNRKNLHTVKISCHMVSEILYQSLVITHNTVYFNCYNRVCTQLHIQYIAKNKIKIFFSILLKFWSQISIPSPNFLGNMPQSPLKHMLPVHQSLGPSKHIITACVLDISFDLPMPLHVLNTAHSTLQVTDEQSGINPPPCFVGPL